MSRKKSLPSSFWLSVDDLNHTEVIGYHASTKNGRQAWDALDWSNWWIDGPEPHIFNPGGFYFHVATKPEHGGAVYRVRCRYAGTKYKGRETESVSIGFKDGKLHWIVRVKA